MRTHEPKPVVSRVRPRLRVAYFVPPSRHFAGIERVVHEIATGLMEADGASDYGLDDANGSAFDVHVVFASHYAEDILDDTRYTKHVLGVARLRGLARALRACVARHDFDVLVVPQVEASVIAWLATRGLRLPVFVAHLHGNPRIEEAEGTRRTRLAFGLFRHIVARRITGVFAVSPSLRDYAADSIARQASVQFVKNPARELAGAVTRVPGEGPFRFLSVGRLSRQKGQDILLRALALARPDLPPVTLTLVGTGFEDTALRALCEELGLEDIVTFAGYASDPTAQFRAADCFVLASRWEGFGMVLIEALHFGLPILAADCEFGPRDIVTEEAIGELVAPDDVAALAAGLRRAAAREPDADAETTRRAAAAGYHREAVTGMHVTALRQLARVPR